MLILVILFSIAVVKGPYNSVKRRHILLYFLLFYSGTDSFTCPEAVTLTSMLFQNINTSYASRISFCQTNLTTLDQSGSGFVQTVEYVATKCINQTFEELNSFAQNVATIMNVTIEDVDYAMGGGEPVVPLNCINDKFNNIVDNIIGFINLLNTILGTF